MGRFKKDDRSLIEISNDNGDHWVAEIPTKAVKETKKALRDAGCDLDRDEEAARNNREWAKRNFDRRDHDQYRCRSVRIVDETEDLEDSYDREDDRSDDERSEQPSCLRWW